MLAFSLQRWGKNFNTWSVIDELFLNFTGGIINCDTNEQWSNAELKA